MQMDPYYQPPENENARIQRINKGILLYVQKPSNIMFYIAKCMNDNIVLFEYCEEKIVKYSWLSLEETDRQRHVNNGNLSLRSDLNPAEDVLYGCNVNIVDNNRILFRMNQPELYDRVFEIVMDAQNNPAIIGNVNNIQCRLEYAYVQMKKGLVPDVEYILLYGRSLTNGNKIVEKITRS